MSSSASRPSAPRPNSPSGPRTSPVRGSQAESGRLLLLEGRSERLASLHRWVARFGSEGHADLRIEWIDDLGTLFESRYRTPVDVTLFVDAEDLPLEDVGLLKRWLARISGARLILVGAPAESPGAQRLWDESQATTNDPEATSRPGWLSFPPDIPALEALLDDLARNDSAALPGSVQSIPPARRSDQAPTRVEPTPPVLSGPESLSGSDAELEELREIEFILGRRGPQSIEETPSLSQSSPRVPSPTPLPGPGSQQSTVPARDSNEIEADEQDPVVPEHGDLESTAEAISLDDDPLAAALEAAARRTSISGTAPEVGEDPDLADAESPGLSLQDDSGRDQDAERIADFLRGLDLKASPSELEAPEDSASTDPAREETDREVPSQEDSTEDTERAGPVSPSLPAQGVHAPWFKDQVADLADIAQRIELGLSAARSADFEATLQTVLPTPSSDDGNGTAQGPETTGADPSHTERKLSVRLDELELEVLRLSQFTRTLGFLAAPPPQGTQTLDLRSLVSEWVQTQAAQAGRVQENGRQEGAPRFLLRVDEELQVRSDKSLLSQAFDALFYVARRATPPGQAVRVRVHRVEDSPGSALAETSIEFERGLLADRTPQEICRPYALRRILPELGPNSLSAARSILEGQGGQIALEDVGGGRMAWRIRLQLSN